MTSFTVTTEELRAIAHRVGDTSAQLRAASRVAGDYHGAAGSPRIDGKLDEFFSEWSDAVHMITQDLEGVQVRLLAAADGYEKTEHRIGEGASGGGRGTQR